MSGAVRIGVLIATLCQVAAYGQTVEQITVSQQPTAISTRPGAASATTTDPTTNNIARPPVIGRTFALIVCGHPGDQEHLDQFAESVSKIREGLIRHYSVSEKQVTVLFGEGSDGLSDDNPSGATTSNTEETENDASPSAIDESVSISDWRPEVLAANIDNLKQTVESLSGKVTQADSLWVIVMGHSHHDRGRTWFNLAGEDLQQNQFAALFADVNAAQQTFFVTIPASGFYVRPLSRPGRVIIAATEPGLEINETLFPHALAETIGRPPRDLPDVDGDGHISLLDLYIAVTTDVANRYADDNLLSTEHAMLDDNGDRRGTEIQLHFLPEDRGGLPTAKQRQKLRAGRDGAAASTIVLSSGVSPPIASESE